MKGEGMNHLGRFALGLSLAVLGSAGWLAPPAAATIVTPQIGGGEVTMMGGAAMKHADVTFDGTELGVTVDDTVPTPILRPLSPGNSFDSSQPWSVLSGTAYNYQYAWNASGFITLPTATVNGVQKTGAIWVERLSATAGLLTYLRPPQWTSGTTWTQILAHDGDIWKWGGSMQHNAYAVLNPSLSIYTTTYKVYLGDSVTGTPWDGTNGTPNFASVNTTWTWDATPVPEPATLTLLGLGIAGLALRRHKR